MATATVTLGLNSSTFLAGMARARSSVNSLGSSVGSIGSKGFAIAGTAIAAFGTATAIGLKKAFDFGGQLADMSAISGRSTKEILLLKRALNDAGVSMEKIDRFILTGQDRGQVIARALENISSADWADAAQSIGAQADILDRNASTFDRVSDLLGRSGDKLRGFFVGAAGSIGNALLGILEKFDKMDFAAQGAKFGAALLIGARALAGFFAKPELLFKTSGEFLKAGFLAAGNVLIAVFKSAIEFFKNGMFEAIVAIGSALLATLQNTIRTPFDTAALDTQIAAKSKVRDAKDAIFPGLGDGMQGDIDKLTQARQGIIDANNATAEGLKNQAMENASAAMGRLGNIASKFKVEDIFGAGKAFESGKGFGAEAVKAGRNFLPQEATGQTRKISGVISSGGQGMLGSPSTESALGYQGGTREVNGWVMPTTGPGTNAKNQNAKTEGILEKLLNSNEALKSITEKAWGGEGE